jgi:DNA-binding HxlR family transcriptional regulator
MLSQQLREMEQDGLILRTKYAQIPPKVEYSLTDLGKSFMPVIFSMNQWGMNYVSESNT